MANLNETDHWPEGVYQLEEDDPVLGGPGGISNQPARELASRAGFQRRRNITPWVATLAYPAGLAYVSHAGTTWNSVAANTGVEPGSDPTRWARWGHTSDELDDVLDAYAEKGGSAAQVFSVAPATAAAHAVRNDQIMRSTNMAVISETQLWTAPAGVHRVRARIFGAGGGGGGAFDAAAASGGGGGGAYVEAFVSLTPGQVVPCTVAARPSGGAGSSNGQSGGATSFGTFATAGGGVGGNGRVAAGSAAAAGGGTGSAAVPAFVVAGQYGGGGLHEQKFGGLGGGGFGGAPSLPISWKGYVGTFPCGGGGGSYGVNEGGEGSAGCIVVEW